MEVRLKMKNFIENQIKTPDERQHTIIAEPKIFKSGKDGYYAHGKLTIDDARYQVALIFTKITPKTKASTD